MDGAKEYKGGFNASFLLAEHELGLLEKLIKNIAPTSTYLEGFIDGKRQFEIEKERIELEQLFKLRQESEKERKDITR